MVRWAAGRILVASVVTPKFLADIATDVTDTLLRNEEARRKHWIGKNLSPPGLKNARTPWSAR
jgi:hypothetical protein